MGNPASSEVPDPGLRQVAGGDHADGALGTGDFALLAYLCRSGGVGDLLGAKKIQTERGCFTGKKLEALGFSYNLGLVFCPE